MNLTILPGAATDDVKQIETIVNNIDQYMTELNEKITRLIPSGVETDWSNELLDSWTNYYNNSMVYYYNLHSRMLVLKLLQ